MKRLILAVLCAYGSLTLAQTENTDEGFLLCEDLFGRPTDRQLRVEEILDVLDHDADARRIYRSPAPGANMIVLVSAMRETRYQAARALVRTLGLDGFEPGIYADRFLSAGWMAHPEMFRADSLIEPRNLGVQAAFAPRADEGMFDSVMLMEKLGRVSPEVWEEANGRFLSHVHPTTREQTTRAMTSTFIVGLVPNHATYDAWTDDPLGTLIAAVRSESPGFDLDDGARERLAAIYYVGRPQEVALETLLKNH